MYFQHIYDKSLAQASYFIGCQKAGVAAVIDAKRDVDTYLEIAKANNMKITHIFETHIHADFLAGSRELPQRRQCRPSSHRSPRRLILGPSASSSRRTRAPWWPTRAFKAPKATSPPACSTSSPVRRNEVRSAECRAANVTTAARTAFASMGPLRSQASGRL